MVATSLLAVLLGAQVALAASVPLLTRQPEGTLSSGHAFVLPAGGRQILAHQIDAIPLIPHDFTDADTRRAIADYDGATFDRPATFAKTFDDAMLSLRAQAADATAIARLRDDLAVNTNTDFDYSYSRGPDGQFNALLAGVTPLKADARNGDRLAIAGVSLFDLAVSTQSVSALGTTIAGRQIVDSKTLKNRALLLLSGGARIFTQSRALAIDSAYLQSSMPGGCSPTLFSVFTAIEPMAKWLAKNPDDVAARILLASLQARMAFSARDLGNALTTLKPLFSNSTTAPLAYATRGDAELETATRRRADAPYWSHTEAELALADYAEALREGGRDPGLYAGAATALDLLGSSSDAIAAQKTAIRSAPKSVAFALGLAWIQMHMADFSTARTTARAAFELAVSNGTPLASSTVLVPGGRGWPIPGDRPILAWSIGSEAPHTSVSNTGGQCGGGYIVESEIVPAVSDPGNDDDRLLDTSPASATLTAIDASIALNDPDSAKADGARWTKLEANNPGGQISQPGISLAVAAAEMAAGRPASGDLDWPTLVSAQSVLRHAGVEQMPVDPARGRDLFSRAAAVCRLGEATVKPGKTPTYQQQIYVPLSIMCDGEASFHAGDFAAAIRAFKKAAADTAGYYSQPVILELAQATLASGARTTAITLFQDGSLQAATHNAGQPYAAAGFEQLGTMALDAGQSAVAVAYYDLAVEALPPRKPAIGLNFIDFTATSPETQLVSQRVHLNRGVARLRTLQSAPDTAPDCAAAKDGCTRARDDFQAALEVDPGNPIFLLDLGWVDRLMGDSRTAATALRSAVAGDLAFNALNDLGVLQARAGDLSAAQKSFQSALALKPDYDLAAWNLGVLWLQRGPVGIPAGEAYLARAIQRNPDLATTDLEYRTDERTYRVIFGATSISARRPPNPAVTAIAVAQLATISAPVMSAPVATFGGWLRDTLPDALARLQRRVRPLLARTAGHAWLVTIPFTVLVAAVMAWSGTSGAGLTAVLVAIGATLLAVLVRECAYVLAACYARAWVRPALWPIGIVAAVLLLPFRLSVGPFTGHEVQPGIEGERAWRVLLVGPLANLAVGGGLYLLYLTMPVPFFRLAAQAQLIILGFSLLPFPQLDGHVLGKRHRWAVIGLGLVVLLVGAYIGLGRG